MATLGDIEHKTYLQVIGGSFVIRVKDEQSLFNNKKPVPRVITKGKNEGKKVWEVHFDTIMGIITKIEKKSAPNGTDYSDQWNIFLDDDMIIVLSNTSRYAKDFWVTIENVDLTIPVKFVPNTWIWEEKPQFAMKLFQGGREIKKKYEKAKGENVFSNGFPPSILKKIKGKDVWDDTDQLEFIDTKIAVPIIKKLEAVKPIVESKKEAIGMDKDGNDLFEDTDSIF
jgi:hypothetical protein